MFSSPPYSEVVVLRLKMWWTCEERKRLGLISWGGGAKPFSHMCKWICTYTTPRWLTSPLSVGPSPLHCFSPLAFLPQASPLPRYSCFIFYIQNFVGDKYSTQWTFYYFKYTKYGSHILCQEQNIFRLSRNNEIMCYKVWKIRYMTLFTPNTE